MKLNQRAKAYARFAMPEQRVVNAVACELLRIPTKPDTESERSQTVIRTIADNDPTKPDSATHRQAQRLTRRRPCPSWTRPRHFKLPTFKA